MQSKSQRSNGCDASLPGTKGQRPQSRSLELRILLIFLIVVGVVILLYFDTFATIVKTWLNTEAFRHGFAIFPIALFLIWRRRTVLRQVEWRPSGLGLVMLAGCSVAWLIGEAVGAQVIMQLAAVSMFPALVVAIAGTQAAKTISFPLGFLIFAVPFGEFLIPYLIDFTASFSVDVLHVLGIPILRDGRYFHIPTGSYEIAKACSGLKYLIATLALATLYTHFLFKQSKKAILFVGFAIVISILANGIRATAVVLLLHYTEMDISTGQDHEFVGWIIYGLMVVVLIWVGVSFQDSSNAWSHKYQQRDSENHRIGDPSSATVIRMGVLALVAIAFGPALSSFGLLSGSTLVKLTSGLPDNVRGWVARDPADIEWRPDFAGYSQLSLGRYTQAADGIDVALVRYLGQKQEAEITNTSNQVVDASHWSLENVRPLTVEIGDSVSLTVQEVVARRRYGSRLIWYWKEVNGVPVDSVLQTKIIEIRERLAGRSAISSAIIMSTPIKTEASDSELLLRQFLFSFYGELRSCVDSGSAYRRCSLGAPGPEED